MIIIRLTGGLGNQLFQYAVGRRLALERGVLLYLDISGFRTYRRHRYGLRYFNIAGREAGTLTMTGLKWLNRLRGQSWRLVSEIGFGFDRAVLSTLLPTYLAGYWQSEKYFAPQATVLRQDLTLKTPPSALHCQWRERIRAVPAAVALHVRRGNFLTMGAKVFTVCTPDYYQQAVEHITRQVGPVTVFVFSDDITWAKVNLALACPAYFVSAAGLPDYEELLLMAACRHHITANSTFSWWGAWLNPHPDKIIVTPRRWFLDPGRSQADLIPTGWVEL